MENLIKKLIKPSMKIKVMKKEICVFTMLALLAFQPASKASNLAIFDDSFNLFNGSTQITGPVLSAVWGTFSGGNFTPNQNIYASGGFGYVDTTALAPELQVIINRVDTTQYAAGTQMALAIFNKPDLSNWDNTVAKVVLTYATWTAPSWSLVGNDKDVFFTSATTALLGDFTYSSTGRDTIVMIPEPSSASLIMMSLVSVFAIRRRNKK